MPTVDKSAKLVTCYEPESEPDLTVYPGPPPLTAMDIWFVERLADAPRDAMLVRAVSVRRGAQLLVMVRPRVDDREGGNNADSTVRTYH